MLQEVALDRLAVAMWQIVLFLAAMFVYLRFCNENPECWIL